MDKTSDRAHIYREVSHVLSRHAVDLRKLNYSCSNDTVYLRGKLIKEPFHDFDVAGIEALYADLKRIPGVIGIQFHLDNWDIDSSLAYIKRIVK